MLCTLNNEFINRLAQNFPRASSTSHAYGGKTESVRRWVAVSI